MNNELLSKVESNVFSFGSAKETDTVKFKFQYTGDVDQVDYLQSTCGCTSVQLDPETGLITGEIEMSKVGKVPEGQNLLPVNKTVYIWFEPGTPRFIRDEKTYQQIPNGDKPRLPLQIVGHMVK